MKKRGKKERLFPLFTAPEKAFPSSSHLARPFGISRGGEALIRSRRYQRGRDHYPSKELFSKLISGSCSPWAIGGPLPPSPPRPKPNPEPLKVGEAAADARPPHAMNKKDLRCRSGERTKKGGQTPNVGGSKIERRWDPKGDGSLRRQEGRRREALGTTSVKGGGARCYLARRTNALPGREGGGKIPSSLRRLLLIAASLPFFLPRVSTVLLSSSALNFPPFSLP